MRGLLGWMLFTFPEEFPEGAKSVRSMRLAFPSPPKARRRARSSTCSGSRRRAIAAPRTSSSRSARSSPPPSSPHGDAGEDEARERRPAVRARASRHAAAAAEQRYGSARVPSLAGGGRAQEGCRGTSTWGSSSGWKTKSRRGGTRAGREQTRRWRGACSGFSSSASCRACRTGNARSASWRSGARCSKNTRRMVAPRETLRRGNEASTTRARHRAERFVEILAPRSRSARSDRPGSTCARTRRGGLRLPLGHQARPRGQNRPKLRRAAADGPRALAVRRLGGVDRAQTRAPGAATRQPVHRAKRRLP